jgi:hypothetical protein
LILSAVPILNCTTSSPPPAADRLVQQRDLIVVKDNLDVEYGYKPKKAALRSNVGV